MHALPMNLEAWEQAKDVITEALKRVPSEREKFVRERCGDSTLAGEIITLLDAYKDGVDFLADPPDEEEDQLEPGTRVGPYVIIDSIGRGGMGHVFLGSDPRLRRKVALKCVIRSLAGSGERRLRILHEARAAASVMHPNVATIHDVVEHDNRAFIVMEYVEGESLASRLKRERMPIDRVIAVGRQLASALSAAHAKHVVHRDLKPGNVHFTTDGAAKILDFGIANAPRMATTVAASGRKMNTSLPTRAGQQPGTPSYMSPQQLMGRGMVDERSDVYSLGVVLFEMATGRRPHHETTAAELVVAISNGTPRADEVDSRVPGALADVIDKALALEIDKRYQTAAELASALESVEREVIVGHEPIVLKAARVVIAMALLPVIVALIGLATTMGFNLTFGLTGPFAQEPLPMYFVWGLKALFGSVFFMTLGVLIILALRVILRFLEAVPAVGRTMKRVRQSLRSFAASVGLNRPSMLAQTITVAALIALSVFIWVHQPLIVSWGSFINTRSADVLRPLAPANVREKTWYRLELDAIVLGLAYGLMKVAQMRRRTRIREGRAGMAMLACLIAIVVLLNEWPYRVFYHSEFERVDYGGDQCYIIGDSVDQYLLFCPTDQPPRNHAIAHADPKVHRLGIIENVFKVLDPDSSTQRLP